MEALINNWLAARDAYVKATEAIGAAVRASARFTPGQPITEETMHAFSVSAVMTTSVVHLREVTGEYLAEVFGN